MFALFNLSLVKLCNFQSCEIAQLLPQISELNYMYLPANCMPGTPLLPYIMYSLLYLVLFTLVCNFQSCEIAQLLPQSSTICTFLLTACQGLLFLHLPTLFLTYLLFDLDLMISLESATWGLENVRSEHFVYTDWLPC